MPSETTTNAEGEVTEVTFHPTKITVSYGRKLRPANYSYEYETVEAQAHVEADVPLEGNDADREIACKEAFLLARSSVYEQLGISYEVDKATQVAKELLTTTLGASESKRSSKPAAAKAAVKRTDAELWAEVVSDPGQWFDNREDKKNPNYPDFKRVGSGEGLWIVDRDGNENVDVSTLPSSGFKN